MQRLQKRTGLEFHQELRSFNGAAGRMGYGYVRGSAPNTPPGT